MPRKKIPRGIALTIWGRFRDHEKVPVDVVYSYKGLDHHVKTLQNELGPEWVVWTGDK